MSNINASWTTPKKNCVSKPQAFPLGIDLFCVLIYDFSKETVIDFIVVKRNFLLTPFINGGFCHENIEITNRIGFRIKFSVAIQH